MVYERSLASRAKACDDPGTVWSSVSRVLNGRDRLRRTAGADWTQYVIRTPEGESEPLRKRRAVLCLVHALHQARGELRGLSLWSTTERRVSCLARPTLWSSPALNIGVAIPYAWSCGHSAATRRPIMTA